MGSCPSWYAPLARTMQLRTAYPGVAPWEWDAHPDYETRVLCILDAHADARQMLKEQAEADTDPTA